MIDLVPQIAAESLLFPAIVAAAVALAIRYVARGNVGEVCEAPLALGVAFAAGCVLLSSLIELVPTRNWHWTLYAVAAAAIAGPLSASALLPRYVRWIPCALVVAATAYFLTPHWNQLWPPRAFCIPLLAAYLFAIYALLLPLAARIEPWRFIAALAGTQFAIAGIIAKSQSLTTARVALLGAGALAGYAVLLWRTAKPAAPVAIALPFAMLAGGWAFCGAIQPQPDEWGLLIAPLAPAALWLTVAGPLKRLAGKRLLAAQIGVVMTVLAVSAAVVELL